MIVKINKETCIGCGACAAVCPEAFRMNDETGKADPTGTGDINCAKNALETCPVQAIQIEE